MFCFRDLSKVRQKARLTLLSKNAVAAKTARKVLLKTATAGEKKEKVRALSNSLTQEKAKRVPEILMQTPEVGYNVRASSMLLNKDKTKKPPRYGCEHLQSGARKIMFER